MSQVASAPGRPTPSVLEQAAVHGYTTAFWWAAGIFAVGAIVCGALLTSRSIKAGAPAGEPAFAHG